MKRRLFRSSVAWILWAIYLVFFLVQRFYIAPRSDSNWFFYLLTEGLFFSNISVGILGILLTFATTRKPKLPLTWLVTVFITTVLVMSPTTGRPNPLRTGTTFSVFTYNIAHCRISDTEQIFKTIQSSNADIICLQEASILDQDTHKLKVALARKMPAYSSYHATNNLIMSKYPLQWQGYLDVPTKWARKQFPIAIVNLPTGPVSVICVHLEPSWVTPFRTEFSELVSTLTKVANDRQSQQAAILAQVRNSKEPVVLAGDFNGAQFAGVPTALKKEMKDALAETSSGFSMTLLPKLPYTRIDFVFTKLLKPINSKLIGSTESDHRGVFVTLEQE